ncbi:MAG: DUF2240 family protein [Candidatus Aenigmarchaeota archaeon]|nr:DUF2240 family protein [Candidatus Aenigmarchaeota archaeon]
MLADLVKIIAADSGLDEDEVMHKIAEKQRELAGLISEEGAAYIVAKELGLSLLRKQERLHIQHIIPGMKNVDIVGKVMRIFPAREFKTEKASGKVMNIILADGSGSVRMSLWNDEIDKVEGLDEGDVVHVKGHAREDNTGSAELRLGRFGIIQKSAERITEIAERRVERSTLADLKDGHYREVRACLVQVFESTLFFELCPQCGSRMREGACAEHGELEPDFDIVVSGIIDDGTDSIRAVLFREHAEKVIGINKHEARQLFDRKRNVRPVIDKIPLGKDFLFEGKVRRNKLFDRLEFVASAVKDVSVKDEIRLLLAA